MNSDQYESVGLSPSLDHSDLHHRILLFNRLVFFLADLVAVFVVSFTVRAWVSDMELVWYQTTQGVMETVYSGIDPFLPLALCGLVYFQAIGLYSRRRPLWDQLRPVVQCSGILFLIDTAFLYISAQPNCLFAAIISWLCMVVTFALVRIGTRFGLKKIGKWYVPTVILGTGSNAQLTAEAILAEPSMGYRICYFVTCPDQANPLSKGEGQQDTISLSSGEIPILDLTPALLSLLRQKQGPHVIIALEAEDAAVSASLMTALAVRPAAINVVPPIHGIPLYGLEVNHLLARELLLLQVRNNLARQAPRFMKRMLDLVGVARLFGQPHGTTDYLWPFAYWPPRKAL
jgi:undecaprenyl-phosphate galactose phosphotransferase